MRALPMYDIAKMYTIKKYIEETKSKAKCWHILHELYVAETKEEMAKGDLTFCDLKIEGGVITIVVWKVDKELDQDLICDMEQFTDNGIKKYRMQLNDDYKSPLLDFKILVLDIIIDGRITREQLVKDPIILEGYLTGIYPESMERLLVEYTPEEVEKIFYGKQQENTVYVEYIQEGIDRRRMRRSN